MNIRNNIIIKKLAYPFNIMAWVLIVAFAWKGAHEWSSLIRANATICLTAFLVVWVANELLFKEALSRRFIHTVDILLFITCAIILIPELE